MAGGLTDREVFRVVNRYIGVSGGYLGDFSYRTHADFYPEYCDLAIAPYAVEGTTRERFIAILSLLTPRDQAKVLRGVIERFPPDAAGGPDTRQAAHAELLALIERLESGPFVAGATPQITSEVVLRALTDAENLIQMSGPTSAVDRVHTVLHGYLLAVCDGAGVVYQREDSMVALFKKLRSGHPQLADLGPRAQDVEKVLNSCASILDALLPVRNRASVAHPNAELLGEPEARLVINVGRTLLDSGSTPVTHRQR
ncbi:MAG: abortive infection family protein [Acidimicrobiales bacterium]